MFTQDHNAHFNSADRLTAFSKSQINASVLPKLNSAESTVLVLFLTRAHTTFAAGVHLCRNGYAVDSVMQSRNLVEQLVTLRFILTNVGTAERWVEYDAASKKRTLDRVLGLGDEFSELKSCWSAQEAQIENNYQSFKAKYKADFNKYYWAGAGNSIRELSKKADSQELYDYFYGSCSEVIHGTVSTSRYYFKLNNTVPTFYPGATPFLLPDALTILLTLFPLFWDEVSILNGKPSWEELRGVATYPLFEYFSRNPKKPS